MERRVVGKWGAMTVPGRLRGLFPRKVAPANNLARIPTSYFTRIVGERISSARLVCEVSTNNEYEYFKLSSITVSGCSFLFFKETKCSRFHHFPVHERKSTSDNVALIIRGATSNKCGLLCKLLFQHAAQQAGLGARVRKERDVLKHESCNR